MSISKEVFGELKDGSKAYKYIIENKNGMKVTVTDFGAILVAVNVKNAKGEIYDVVLGYDELEKYEDNFDMLGTTVGRNVNRIEHGKFSIDDILYQLDINENDNNIHSHMEHGFHKVLWKSELISDCSVCFSYFSPDGENGFSGNLEISVTYTLTDADGMIISYYGICDKKTLLNMTNHSYFNLSGYGLALEAFALNPLIQSGEEGKRVLDELLVAHEKYLPQFKVKIQELKELGIETDDAVVRDILARGL